MFQFAESPLIVGASVFVGGLGINYAWKSGKKGNFSPVIFLVFMAPLAVVSAAYFANREDFDKGLGI